MRGAWLPKTWGLGYEPAEEPANVWKLAAAAALMHRPSTRRASIQEPESEGAVSVAARGV